MLEEEGFVCPWCGQHGHMVFVKSHYECNACHRPVMDCCDGERAEKTTEQK
jgi:hypothetical protein